MPIEQDEPRPPLDMHDLNPILKSIGIHPDIHKYALRRSMHQFKTRPDSYIFVGLLAPFSSVMPPDMSWEMRLTSAYASLASGSLDAARALGMDKYGNKYGFCLVTNGTSAGGVGIANRLARTQANWKLLALVPQDPDLALPPFPVHKIVSAPKDGKEWLKYFLRHVDLVLMLDEEHDTGLVPQFKI